MGACNHSGVLQEGEILEGAGTGEAMIVIPESQVWIVGKAGEEALVEKGSLKFLTLKQPSQEDLKMLYIGDDPSDLSQGFFLPLKEDTAVTYRDGVIACDAGDGDVFGFCLPPDIDDATLEVLDELLYGCSSFVSRRKPRTEAERKVADVERRGQEVLAAIKQVEEQISKGIKDAGKMADQKLAEHKVKLPAAAKGGVHAVKGVTHGTVKVSEKIIGGVVDIAANAAKQAAKGGTVAAKSVAAKMPAQQGNGGGGASPAGDAIAVGQAGCVVAVQVIDALFEASDKLYVEAIGETENVAKNKYGEDVAQVAKDGMIMGKDVFDIYKITGSGGGKEAAKLVVKKTLAKKALSHTAKGIAMGVKEGLADAPK